MIFAFLYVKAEILGVFYYVFKAKQYYIWMQSWFSVCTKNVLQSWVYRGNSILQELDFENQFYQRSRVRKFNVSMSSTVQFSLNTPNSQNRPAVFSLKFAAKWKIFRKCCSQCKKVLKFAPQKVKYSKKKGTQELGCPIVKGLVKTSMEMQIVT